ncbi:hypothetical protein BP6252_01271 [Coleophoma cylindrospora]|uniref:Fe2OG dioxygenase domain-containing protein n=1 Tax=Coleophoma cylindrospora TaxID=1849047 RepID=A0A3D8SSE0_9HELO|nr:hypothetical protein BP6252_01271 [Coleophoma cylindrospora]
MAGIPVVDLRLFASDPDRLSGELFDAASKWGFLILTGHGIPQEEIDGVFNLAQGFFSQPKEVKEEKWMNTAQVGYDHKESVTELTKILAQSIGIQEGCVFGDVAASNLTTNNLSSWWTHPRREQIEAFRARCHDLSNQLLTAFATAMSLPPGYFFPAHDPAKTPGNVLRLMRYPALATQPETNFPSLGEHTDWGTMTLLFTKTGGLEVKSPDAREFVPVPVVEGALVVNIGDGLALWSDGALKSTLHRVSREASLYDQDRYSMAYFVNANADAPLKFLKRGPEGKFTHDETKLDATFGDYQAARMRLFHEKFDSDVNGSGPVLDPKFVAIVKSLGVAHGHAITYGSAGVEKAGVAA